jgi:AAA ATPase-like protein
MPAGHGLGLLARTRERELVDGMLAKVREGQSAVLVVCGEAGIGKTALLRYAARQASGLRVAQIAGVQAEMELSFAGDPTALRTDARPDRFASGAAAERADGRVRRLARRHA